MRLSLILLLSGTFLSGCATLKEGAPVELADAAAPHVADQASVGAKAALTPPRAAPVPRGGFKAWIPRRVTPNGDVHEGHYVDVSEKAPQKELTKPDYEVPKAPKQIYRPAAKKEAPSGLGTSYTPPLRPVLPPQGSVSPLSPLPPEGPYEPVQP